MKKIPMLLLLLLCGSTFAQKKKTSPKAPASIVISKLDNLTAEMVKNNFYLFINNGTTKDTLLLKTYDTKDLPTECKISNFTSKGTKMNLITWTEKKLTETKLKKEDAVITESQIWDPTTKVLLIGNTHAVTKIKEIVFLDRLKNASETQERIRSSGYTFTLLADGDFSLMDKNSVTKYSYNPTTFKYEVTKAAAATPSKPTKKKKK